MFAIVLSRAYGRSPCYEMPSTPGTESFRRLLTSLIAFCLNVIEIAC